MTKTHNILLALTAGLTLAFSATTVSAAGNMAGQLNASTVLQSGCIVSNAPGAGTTGVNFGTLDFGTHPSTFTGVLTTAASGGVGGAGATQIVCSPDVTSLTVSVSAGNNAGQGATIGTGARAMKFGASSYLPYDVYSDAAMTAPYPTSASTLAVSLPGTGAAIALPVYGRINKTNLNALAAGTYTDVLQVTLAW